MKGKKNATVGHIDIDSEILAELFPGDDSFALHDFDIACLAALGQFISYVSALAGSVTFYRSSTNNSQCVSFRLGQRKRTFELDGNDVDTTIIEQLTNGVKRAYLAKLQLSKATELAEQGSKEKKKRK